jgi:dynein heavy chain
MNVVLIHETKRFNNLLNKIQESISNLTKTIQGKLIMSRELEEDFMSLLVGKVPDAWLAKSYPSIKSLANYINDLSERLKFFKVNYFKHYFSLKV